MRFWLNKSFKEAAAITLPLFIFYLFFQAKSIFGGDCGDLVAAASVWGVPHPPGYPLYTVLAGLLIRIPIFTPAWRVALISSSSSALSLGLLYLIVKKLTKNRLVSLITVLTLAISYIFWLYSEVPEVFALNILFITILIFLSLSWYQKPNLKSFYLFIFFLSLALTHHHTILFLAPGFIYLFRKKRNFFKKWRTFAPKSIVLFLVALIPYLYLPIAASANPPIDWGHPVNLESFLQVITRSIYGTFSSSQIAVNESLFRLVQIPTYFVLLNFNLTTLGVFLVFLGMIFLYKKDKILFYFLGLLFLFAGPFFFFYASFPIGGRFLMATIERFLTISLPIAMIFFALGEIAFANLVIFLLKIVGINFKVLPIKNLIIALFFLIPAFILRANFGKMDRLRNDFLPDKYGEDILKTVEPGSILLLTADQPLFNSQYVYYAKGFRKKEIKLIIPSLLDSKYYRESLKKTYPELMVPQENDPKKFAKIFIKENIKNFPVYSNVQLTEEGVREPRGLLLKFHLSQDQVPTDVQVAEKNTEVWRQYQDLSSYIGKDYHLFLLSVIDSYRVARIKLGRLYLQAGLYQDALEQFNQAELIEKNTESSILIGVALSQMGRCQEADDRLSKILMETNDQKKNIYNLLFLNAQNCFKQDDKIQKYKKLWEETKTSQEGV